MSFFSSKTIWITGASSGIGEALVKEFSKAGANIIMSARRSHELERVKNTSSHPEKIAILTLDLENNQRAEEWVKEAWSVFNGVDILINNGGLGQFGSVLETKADVERKLFEVNYFGAVALTKAILPRMIEASHGKIVAIASIAGKFGQANLAAYSSSKAALILYFESLKEELHDSPIDIQVISPGFINTQVTINSLDASGKPLNKNSPAQENGMPAQKFALRLLKALQGRRFHSYIGQKELLAVPLHSLAPRLFYSLLRKSK